MPVKEFNIFIGFLFFIGYFIFDVLYSKFILAVQALNANKAGTFSLILGTISFAAIIGADVSPYYGIPCVLGQGAGAWSVITFEKWRLKKAEKEKK
jgi:hypothetical protein